MRIVFAPSGRRMIPYPPCGPAVLEAAVSPLTDVRVVDLEMLVWHEAQRGTPIPMYEGLTIDPSAVLAGTLTPEIAKYQELLYQLCSLEPGEHLAISVMGYEQLASALLLMQKALESGSRVIMGGQFFSRDAASQLVSIRKSDRLTVTVGDGFVAIRTWMSDASAIPVNSYVWRDGLQFGGQNTKAVRPPVPHYSTVDWSLYERYAAKVFRDSRPIRRAHIYVWDKQCPFKCTFCRVSSGSEAKLTKPSDVANLYRRALQLGVSQLNFMTNELNPSLGYMKKLIAEMERIDTDFSEVAWFTYLRPDEIDAEDFVRLRRLGCRLVRYGVETGSQRLSDLMRKDYRIEIIEEVLRRAADADIFNHVNFLVGFPGETESDLEQTLEFIERNKAYIHSVRINPFYLPPGSPMAKDPEANGIKLVKFNKGFWEFDVLNGQRTTSEQVALRIERLVSQCMQHDIGFAATLPFETISILSMHKSRDAAIAHMRDHYPFLWQVANSDSLKAHFGGYAQGPASWNDTIYKRGRNYNVVLCND
jgi:hypothetical protein